MKQIVPGDVVGRHEDGDFRMTGSHIFRLMQGIQESLAGRVAQLHMSPLTQREIDGRSALPFSTNFDSLVADKICLVFY